MSTERQTPEQWRERVQRWKESGLTAPEFSAREGCKPGTLRWWSSYLARGQQRRGRAATSSTPSFVPVVVEAAASRGGTIEVRLASGHTLRVTPDFDDATLRRVVSALEGAR
jgi:transposase